MTARGMLELNEHLKMRSYLEGNHYSKHDKECFESMSITPDKIKYPYAYRWYIHIASLHGIRFLPVPTQLPRDDDEDIFAAAENCTSNPQGPRESRSDMMARVKQEIQESMTK